MTTRAPSRGEQLGGDPAHAAARAGDQRNLPVQSSTHIRLTSFAVCTRGTFDRIEREALGETRVEVGVVLAHEVVHPVGDGLEPATVGGQDEPRALFRLEVARVALAGADHRGPVGGPSFERLRRRRMLGPNRSEAGRHRRQHAVLGADACDAVGAGAREVVGQLLQLRPRCGAHRRDRRGLGRCSRSGECEVTVTDQMIANAHPATSTSTIARVTLRRRCAGAARRLAVCQSSSRVSNSSSIVYALPCSETTSKPWRAYRRRASLSRLTLRLSARSPWLCAFAISDPSNKLPTR